MYRTLNIPIEATQKAIKAGYLHELRVYLALKFVTDDGQIRLSEIDYEKVCDLSGFQDQRTIDKHIESLQGLNWIGTDNTWLFIRSFERLREILEAPSRSAVELRPQDIETIHEFILSARIKHSAKAKRYARKKPGAKPHAKQLLGIDYSPESISCSLIGQWFGYSPSTASRVKQRAKEIGYLDYQHASKKIDVPKADLTAWMKCHGIGGEYIFYKNRVPYLRLTDQFCFGEGIHNFHFKTRPQL